MQLTTIVREIYAAFGRGDIPAILDRLDENVDWEHWPEPNSAQRAGVPWLLPRKGKAGALEFFEVVAQMQFRRFEVLSIMEGPGQVACEIELEAVMPGGAEFKEQEIHLWTFNSEGRVTRMRHYGDLNSHIEAARSMAAPPMAAAG